MASRLWAAMSEVSGTSVRPERIPGPEQDAGVSPLTRFVRARHVAVFGANERHHHTRMVVEGARAVGFPVESLYLVNPRYRQVLGLPCYPNADLLDLSDGVAVIVSAANTVVTTLEQAAKAGCRAAVVLAEGFAGRGEQGEALETSLRQTAGRLDVVLLGPNTLGLTSPGFGVSVWTGDGIRQPLRVGAVSLLFQSSGMLNVVLSVAAHARLGVRMALSVGNEGGVELVEALEFAAADNGTRVVGVYCEAIHDPRRVARALLALAQLGKPVVMLSSGRSDRSRRNALAHAGRLASGGANWEALCHKLGVILVKDLDEFLETLHVAEYGAQVSSTGVGLVTVSGGDVSLLSDLTDDIGLDVPAPGEGLRRRIADELGSPDTIGNPLDCGGFTRQTIIRATELLCSDDSLGIVAFRCMQPPLPSENAIALYTELFDVARRQQKLPILLTRMIEPLDGAWFRLCADLGVPLLMSYRPALTAIANLLAWVGRRAAICADPPNLGALPTVLSAPSEGALQGLDDAWPVVASLGLQYVAARLCDSPSAAAQVADEIGYPVAVKGVSRQLAHKSQAGAVVLDVWTAADVESAAVRVTRAMEAAGMDEKAFEVQRMLPRGPQLMLGVSADPVCGRIVLAGRGGTDVEFGPPPLILIPPLSEREADDVVDRLLATGLLAGTASNDESDYRFLVRDLLVKFCQRALELPDEIAQVDVNPIILDPAGSFAVDAVVVSTP